MEAQKLPLSEKIIYYCRKCKAWVYKNGQILK